MNIECTSNHGTKYLRVMEGYRDADGKSKRRSVRNIGPLSRFDDGQPDYVKRLQQSFKDGTPIIDTLSDLVAGTLPADYVTIQFDRHDAADYTSAPKNIGYMCLDGLYDALGIYDVLNKHKSQSRIEYDLNGLAKLLIFGRALMPDSKCETWNGRNEYAFEVVSSKSLIEIYRALDVLDEVSGQIQRRMDYKIKQGIGRDSEICYYDVTNYWFEIDDNDADTFDDDGNLVRSGMRKSGPSKAKNRKPIVQMGLFIDANGIPITYRLFPGNNIDQTTLRPAMREGIDRMGYGKVIIVADGGLNSDKNIAHILSEGNGYILSKSTKKSTKAVREWILDESGYEWNADRTFKVKSMLRERSITDEHGAKTTIKEKLISYWSRKHYDRERKENVKFIEYLESVIQNPDKLKDNEKKIERFLNTTEVDKSSGEIVKTKKILSINIEKVQEYLDLLGYYTLLTSEMDRPDGYVINKYRGLSRIEDSFRIIKTDLDGRPVHVRTPKHINAHFLTCFISLTMIRLIQYKVLTHQNKSTLNVDGWESGVTAEKIKKALGSFSADALPKGYYRTTEPNDDMKLIFDAFHIVCALRLPTKKELFHLKKEIDAATIL